MTLFEQSCDSQICWQRPGDNPEDLFSTSFKLFTPVMLIDSPNEVPHLFPGFIDNHQHYYSWESTSRGTRLSVHNDIVSDEDVFDLQFACNSPSASKFIQINSLSQADAYKTFINTVLLRIDFVAVLDSDLYMSNSPQFTRKSLVYVAGLLGFPNNGSSFGTSR